MDDRRVGRIIRQVRIRRAWRQADLAAAAGVSRATVSDLERGRLDGMTLGIIRRVAERLDVRLAVDAWWRSGDAERLLDSGHAALVEHVVTTFRNAGWLTRVEASFNHYGERGSTDVVAWHPTERVLVIVEVKTRITDVQELTATFGRKVRILPATLEREAGWQATRIVRLLVLPDTSQSRTVVRSHAGTLATLWSQGTAAVRRGIVDPTKMPDGAIWFVPTDRMGGADAGLRARGTARVRSRSPQGRRA